MPAVIVTEHILAARQKRHDLSSRHPRSKFCTPYMVAIRDDDMSSEMNLWIR